MFTVPKLLTNSPLCCAELFLGRFHFKLPLCSISLTNSSEGFFAYDCSHCTSVDFHAYLNSTFYSSPSVHDVYIHVHGM